MYNLKTVQYPNGEVKIIHYKIPVSGNVKEKAESKGTGDPEKSILSSMNRAKNKILDLSRSNDWEWFLTFNFNKNKVDRYDYDSVSKLMSKWLNNQKTQYPEMRYLIVPELHKDGAYHFHGLVSNGLSFTRATNPHNGTLLKDRVGREVYNVEGYHIGFTTATKVTETKRAGNYITKYITKELCSTVKGKKKYWHSRNLQEPVIQKALIPKEQIDEIVKDFKDTANYCKVVKPKSFEEQQITYIEINISASRDGSPSSKY